VIELSGRRSGQADGAWDAPMELRVGDTCDRSAARDDGRRSSATGARGDLGDDCWDRPP
jgi:hypothetical protein